MQLPWRETGIAWSTLNSWYNNQASSYDAPVLTRYANILIARKNLWGETWL